MNSQQITFIIILGLAAMCSAHIAGITTDSKPLQFYCGRNLPRALALLCYGVEETSKRSDVGMYTAVLSSPYKEQSMHMDGPWIVPYKAQGMSTQRNKRQYIVNECCDKPCSISELTDYCPY